MGVLNAENAASGIGLGDIALWSGVAVLVIAAHAYAGFYAYNNASKPMTDEPLASAIMIDLLPESVAPEAVQTDEAEPFESEVSEVFDDTVEQEPVKEPVEEPVVPDVLEPAEEPEEITEAIPDEVPDLETVKLPEVMTQVPLPRPQTPKKVSVKERKPVAKPPAKPAKAPPPSVAAQKSATADTRWAAPAPSASSGRTVSPAKWQSRVNAHLRRYKRYPSGAKGSGVATVQFSIDASGTVTGVSLAKSSGDGILDNAAVALVQRASPIPAPPPEMAKGPLRLALPIEFARR